MSEDNGQAVDIAVLHAKTDFNSSEIDSTRSWVNELSNDVKEVKAVQTETLVVLQKMETSLEHMNEKLSIEQDSHKEQLAATNELQKSYITVSTKFRMVMGILTLIGTSLLGIAVKILLFSPNLNGGG